MCLEPHRVLPSREVSRKTTLKHLRNSKAPTKIHQTKQNHNDRGKEEVGKGAENSTVPFAVSISLPRHFQGFCSTNQIKITAEEETRSRFPDGFLHLEAIHLRSTVPGRSEPSSSAGGRLSLAVMRSCSVPCGAQPAAAASPKPLGATAGAGREKPTEAYKTQWLAKVKTPGLSAEFWPWREGFCSLSERVKWHQAFLHRRSQAPTALLNHL